MRITLLFTILLISACLFFACDEKDNFTNSPNIRLSFSTDTISFDTVFTTFGSTTKRMRIYNRSNNSISINSIELVGAQKSGFRINVDGISGDKISNIDILRNDSLFLFVEVTVDPQDSNSPILIRDSIRFQYNGNTQYIQLEAFGQDVHYWKGKTIISDTTLTGEKPFLIGDSLVIKKGATLNIEKNTRMFFNQKAKVQVYGSINAIGTESEPVVFRGSRSGNLLSNVPYDRVPGQWQGIMIDSLSFNNKFENFRLRNSIYGLYFAQSTATQKKATIRNTIIHNTTQDGLSATNCNIDGYNSQFSNAGGSVVKLIGGSYSFLHCTLANYISWWGMSKNSALIIGNVTDKNQLAPLNQCEFTNSIIAGLSNSELKFQNKSGGNVVNIPFSHLFTNCLIKIKGEDDENFVNTLWNVDPKFVNINLNKDYLYDFRLDSISPALSKANPILSQPLPYDIVGTSRFTNGDNPDLGCYEWIKSNK